MFSRKSYRPNSYSLTESAFTVAGGNIKEAEESKPVDFHKQLFHFNSCIQFDLADFLFNQGVEEETFSIVLIGSATASLVFLIALLLWAFLLTAERFSELDT